jgi:hypothetical protein
VFTSPIFDSEIKYVGFSVDFVGKSSDPQPSDILRRQIEENGNLELSEDHKSRIEERQGFFYWLIEKECESKQLYAAILDDLTMVVVKAVRSALGIKSPQSEEYTIHAMWRTIERHIEGELYNEHLGDLRSKCSGIFAKYHGLGIKGASGKQLEKVTLEGVLDDFKELGGFFNKLFREERALFLNAEQYRAQKIFGYVPEIDEESRADEIIGIHDIISREKPLGKWDTEAILIVENAYWERGYRDKFEDLLEGPIILARDEQRSGDEYHLLMRKGSRILEKENWLVAESCLRECCRIAEKFGKDRRYAKTLQLQQKCQIELGCKQDTVEKLREAYDIFEHSGDLKGLLSVASDIVMALVKIGDEEKSKDFYERSRGIHGVEFHPRGVSDFHQRCAEAFLNSKEDELIDLGRESLMEAIKIRKERGMFSELIEVLELQKENEENRHKKSAICREIDGYVAIITEKDEGLLKWKVGEEDDWRQLVEYLVEFGFYEGLRELFLAGMPGVREDSIWKSEGDYGEFWRRLDDAQELSRKGEVEEAKKEYNRLQKIAEENDSPWMIARCLQEKIRNEEEWVEKGGLIKQLIEVWTDQESLRGRNNHMAALARHYSKSQKNRIRNGNRANDLFREVCEFFRGVDNSNYAYYSFDKIRNLSRLDFSVEEIASQWDELAVDADVPKTPWIEMELGYWRAQNIQRSNKSSQILPLLSRNFEILVEELHLTPFLNKNRHWLARSVFRQRFYKLIGIQDIESAREMVESIRQFKSFNSSDIVEFEATILHSEGDLDSAFRKLKEAREECLSLDEKMQIWSTEVQLRIKSKQWREATRDFWECFSWACKILEEKQKGQESHKRSRSLKGLSISVTKLMKSLVGIEVGQANPNDDALNPFLSLKHQFRKQGRLQKEIPESLFKIGEAYRERGWWEEATLVYWRGFFFSKKCHLDRRSGPGLGRKGFAESVYEFILKISEIKLEIGSPNEARNVIWRNFNHFDRNGPQKYAHHSLIKILELHQNQGERWNGLSAFCNDYSVFRFIKSKNAREKGKKYSNARWKLHRYIQALKDSQGGIEAEEEIVEVMWALINFDSNSMGKSDLKKEDMDQKNRTIALTRGICKELKAYCEENGRVDDAKRASAHLSKLNSYQARLNKKFGLSWDVQKRRYVHDEEE